MEPLNVTKVSTPYGEKSVSVFACDIRHFDRPIDVLTASSFRRSYVPTPGTLFGALETVDISAERLSERPDLDLRKGCDLWLSAEILNGGLPIRRLGCIELRSVFSPGLAWQVKEEEILTRIQAYFRMLDVASVSGIPMETVALPLLGAGCQQISADLMLIPMLNECLSFLQRNPVVKEIYFIDYSPSNAFKIASMLEKMYTVSPAAAEYARAPAPSGSPEEGLVFISYNQRDRQMAERLCCEFESRGMKAWYAPRDVHDNDYATSIFNAIVRCSHFVVIVSEGSMQSEHVLNEVNLAFDQLRRNIRLLPLKTDGQELRPAFAYYLARQHWTDVSRPPMEDRLREFADRVLAEDR